MRRVDVTLIDLLKSHGCFGQNVLVVTSFLVDVANVAFEWFEKHACLGGKSWVTDTGMLDSIACFLSIKVPKDIKLLAHALLTDSTVDISVIGLIFFIVHRHYGLWGIDPSMVDITLRVEIAGLDDRAALVNIAMLVNMTGIGSIVLTAGIDWVERHGTLLC